MKSRRNLACQSVNKFFNQDEDKEGGEKKPKKGNKAKDKAKDKDKGANKRPGVV